VTITHFFKYNGKIIYILNFLDGESKDFAPKFDEFTNEYRGIFRIGACDCEENAKLCEKENI
jgi:hypothetical protein